MKKIFAAIKRSKMRVAAITMVAASVLVPAALFAWGPDRPTYTIENPADHVTFNSITNNPAYGDERNFVRIKDASASNSTYSDNVAMQPGKEYEVYVYYHNNASSTLNDAAHDFKGIAKDAKLRMEMPAIVKAGQTGAINGYISASNATPGTVYDDAKATTTSDIALRYVPNSAKIFNAGATNGQNIANTMMTTGAPLGFDQLNGDLPGCNHYSGYVTFRIKADQPNFEVTKQVSKAGQNAYTESVAVNAGDKVDYKIKYLNTGTVQQDNVVIKDKLPAGVTYVPGTTYVSNAKTNNQWSKVAEDTVTTNGINVGSYAPGGAVYVKFTATVAGDNALVCGVTTMVNTATANTENGAKSDTATVTVNKTCQPGTINVCDLSTKKVVNIKEDQFDSSKYSKNLADCAQMCTVPGHENLPANSPLCEKCTVPGHENAAKDSSECVTELPETGIDTGIAAFIGLGTITAGLGYALTSARIRKMLIG
jgi:uncharacterized repeat protein (TIGR01451 family)